MPRYKILIPISGYINAYVTAENKEKAIEKYEEEGADEYSKPYYEFDNWLRIYELDNN